MSADGLTSEGLSAESLPADGLPVEGARVESPPPTPWELALAEVEAGLDEAEALVAPGYLLEAEPALTLGRWAPPAGLGPLPAGLADRALAILDRQGRLAPLLEEAARATRTHLRAVGAMRTNDTSASVYVDTVG